jgi:uncharacterized protein DUF6165
MNPGRQAMKAPQVPVSWGELIDKISILAIKSTRLSNDAARANVRKELELLQAKVGPNLGQRAVLGDLEARLTAVNEALWDVEDQIREKEKRAEFDGDFVAMARSVYRRNDERAAIKREINLLLESDIVEEKSYR